MEDFLSQPQAGALSALRRVSGDILVLGAGGKMGLHLCLMLRKALDSLCRSDRVFAASRFSAPGSRSLFESNSIPTFAGDFRDDAFVETLPDCPIVFYLVGVKFGTSDNLDLLSDINVKLAEKLALRFRRSLIVAFSTGCVYSYATPESGGSTEDSETSPVGEYAISCLEREKRFEEISRAHGTAVALIRLNYSVEFRYGVLVDIAKKLLQGDGIDLSVGQVNVIWQNDALNHIIQCLEIADSPACPINITGAAILNVRDISIRLGELLGCEPRFSGKPNPTAWLSNAGKSHQRFGFPSVSEELMMEWIATWLVQGGHTLEKPTGFERRDGRF